MSGFDAIWLSLADDPSTQMGFPDAESYRPQPAVPGDERQGPSGRIRAFNSGGLTFALQVQLNHLERQHVEFLTAYVGRLMCFRDHHGRKLFGRYRDPGFDEAITGVDPAAVQLTFIEVTFAEAIDETA